MMFKSYILIFGLIILMACEKDPPPPPPPHIDQGAVINLINPSDSSYFITNSDIRIKAAITGQLKDYSFLRFAVLIADTKDTLKSGSVPANGLIEASWKNLLPPGKYKIEVIAFNPGTSNELIRFYSRLIFICVPPPVQITMWTKDDTSITFSWTKSDISNFKAYEVFVTRTDTARDRPPYPEGKKIATITDINATSFKDNRVLFYYKYEYVVRVVSQEDCSNNSEIRSIQAGTLIDLPGVPSQVGTRLYDKIRNRIYYQESTSTTRSNLYVIDPEMPAIVKTIPLDDGIVYINLHESNNKLNLVKKLSNTNYQLMSMDLNSFTIQGEELFSLPPGALVEGVAGKLILFRELRNVQLLNLATGTSTGIRQQADRLRIDVINNNSRFIVPSYDSIFIYHFTPNPQLIASRQVPYFYSHEKAHYSNNIVAIQGQLYDSSFNLIRALPFPQYYIGISADGQYVVSNKNDIYRTSDGTIVKNYGDGFGVEVFFSANNKTLYHITAGTLNPKWNPVPRLFRYPW